jgi:hypothetical protein
MYNQRIRRHGFYLTLFYLGLELEAIAPRVTLGLKAGELTSNGLQL